jgi:hypothetical protein
MSSARSLLRCARHNETFRSFLQAIWYLQTKRLGFKGVRNIDIPRILSKCATKALRLGHGAIFPKQLERRGGKAEIRWSQRIRESSSADVRALLRKTNKALRLLGITRKLLKTCFRLISSLSRQIRLAYAAPGLRQ